MPADLDEVRDRVLDFLAPAAPLGEDAAGDRSRGPRGALALLDAPDLLDRSARPSRRSATPATWRNRF